MRGGGIALASRAWYHAFEGMFAETCNSACRCAFRVSSCVRGLRAGFPPALGPGLQLRQPRGGAWRQCSWDRVMRLLSAMPSRLRGVVAGVPAMFKECALACTVPHVQLVAPHPGTMPDVCMTSC